LRGEKLTVDLTSGVSHVEAGSGPVKMLIQQSNDPNAPKFGPQQRTGSRR
jgi:hypothetical protein